MAQQLNTQAMAEGQAVINGKPVAVAPFGWLVFWTLPEQENNKTRVFDLGSVRVAAAAAQVPMFILERLGGLQAGSAWKRATQLGAAGKASSNLAGETGDMISRWLTRDAGDNADDIRILVRETTDSSEARVRVINGAVLTRENDKLSYSLTEEVALYPEAEKEVKGICLAMAREMNRLQGNINSQKIRQLVMSWLEKNYRVAVRGTGGVYLVPRPQDPLLAEEVRAEMLSIRAWLTGDVIDGKLSIVELFDTEDTDRFVGDAIMELQAEIDDVEAKLKGWRKNKNMNDGSKRYSAGTMVERVQALFVKVDVLEGSLGNEIGICRDALDGVLASAVRMEKEAAGAIETARSKRDAAKVKDGDDKKKVSYAKKEAQAL